MMNGETPKAIITDAHLQHIMEHKAVLASPESRKDPVVVKSVIAHLNEHLNLLRTGDPALLAKMGQEPVAPAAPAGPGGPAMPGQPPMQPGRGGPIPPPAAADIAPAGMETDMAAKTNMPRMPKNPLSGQEFDNETGGL